MCFKAGIDELDTVKNLMSMSLNALIADTLEVELDAIHPHLRLVTDLGMDADKAQLLKEGIAEYFDGLEVDLVGIESVADLLEVVVLNEFAGLPVDCSLPAAPFAETHAAA